MTAPRPRDRGCAWFARATATASALLVGAASSAHAGGLARPNALSARATGMGGAYTAVADDPTALHFNPAGLSFGASGVFAFSVEAVAQSRRYSPQFEGDTCVGESATEACNVQEADSPIIPLPSAGYSFRPTIDGVPSRLTVGVGSWVFFGGQATFPTFENQNLPALEESTSLAVEITPGFSYEVNDKLAIGAALRVGVGVLSLVAQNKPIDANLSGVGVGVGANLGLMLRPTDALSIGAVYRTAMTNSIDGDGEFDFGRGPQDVSFDFDQQWPQSAGFGVAYRAGESILVSAQLDWFNWSRLNSFVFRFPAVDLPDQTIRLDWRDNFIGRLGAELSVSDAVTARLGAGYDSRVMPDRTIDRAISDGHQLFGTAGVSVRVAEGWTIDGAFEYTDTATIDVPDNRDELGDVVLGPPGSITPATAANHAPGQHDLSTLGLTVGLRFQH